MTNITIQIEVEDDAVLHTFSFAEILCKVAHSTSEKLQVIEDLNDRTIAVVGKWNAYINVSVQK